MADDERERRVEDLFEGLDEFFAPIESGDWPDEAEAPPPVEEDAEAEGDDDWSPEIVIPDEEELFAGGAEAEEQAEALEVAEGEGEEPPEEVVSEPTREMQAEELSDLAFPEPSAEEAEGGAPGPFEAWDREEEAPPSEVSRELTVEDLRPPSEYADLPRPDEEAMTSFEDEMPSEEAPMPVVVEPDDADLGLFGEPEGEREPEAAMAASLEEPPPEEELEEAPEDVEAAADHFAEGLRESPEEVERELLADLEPAEENSATVRISGLPEDAGGPSWEDAAIGTVIREREEEAAPPPPEPPRRNLVAALVSGVVLGALVLALLAIGKGPFAVVAGGLILLAQAELYGVVTAHRYRPATALGLVTGGLVLGAAYFKGEAAMLFTAALGMALSMLWFMASPVAIRKRAVMNIGVSVMGILYVPFLGGYALLILGLPGNLGRDLLLTVLVLTVLYDVCAFAIGSLWGSRPLAPNISPRKSWEGAIGATFILLLVGLALVPSVDPFTASRAVGLALVISVFAPIGDLAESVLKRDLGVKDMSGILPGHGGILDRIDSLLFTIPASFYFFRLVF